MELGVLARRDAFPFDAGLHAADVGHVVVGQRMFPDEGPDEGHEAFPEVPVSGHQAGPEKSLAFPGLGPPLEVGGVPDQVAGQASLAPLGAETEVDGGHALGRARSVEEPE
jgi:hypothetical protein